MRALDVYAFFIMLFCGFIVLAHRQQDSVYPEPGSKRKLAELMVESVNDCK